MLVIVGIVLEIGAVPYAASWSGSGSRLDADGKIVPAKTLWDWFELLIVPLILAIGGIVINSTIQRSERQQADERAKVDREIATV